MIVSHSKKSFRRTGINTYRVSIFARGPKITKKGTILGYGPKFEKSQKMVRFFGTVFLGSKIVGKWYGF